MPEQSGGVRASNSPKSNLMPPKKGRCHIRAARAVQLCPKSALGGLGDPRTGSSRGLRALPARHTHPGETLWPAGLAGGDLWWSPAAVPQAKDATIFSVWLSSCGVGSASPAGFVTLATSLCRHQRDGMGFWGVLQDDHHGVWEQW